MGPHETCVRRAGCALLILFICFLSPLSHAGLLEDGQAAYDKRDLHAAAKLWLEDARQGNPEAQYKAGRLYLIGLGVGRDRDKALEWFYAAANQGHALAEMNIGYMIMDKRYDVTDDGIAGYLQSIYWFYVARQWHLRAASRGFVPAYTHIGELYDRGLSPIGGDTNRYFSTFILPDEKEAKKWFRWAAERGDAEAQWRLGFLYEHGELDFNDPAPRKGHFVDLNEAYFWYSLAASAPAKFQGTVADECLEKITPKITPEGIATARQRMLAWKPIPVPAKAWPSGTSP